MFVVRDAFDDGNSKDGAGDFFGVGILADSPGKIVDGFGGWWKIWSDLFKEWEGEFKACHKEGTAFGTMKNFGEVCRGHVWS